MQIDIYLKFIGNFQVPQDEPTAEEMAEEEKQKQRRAKNREKVARCMERKKLKDAQEKEDATHENDSAVRAYIPRGQKRRRVLFDSSAEGVS